MSKYIIELGDSAKKVVAIYLDEGVVWTGVQVVEDLEILNSDYINEHYGSLQDEAYQRGYDKGYADKTNNDEVCKELAKDIYQKGLDAAWEAARKVAFNSDDGGLDIEELDEIFGCYSLQGVFKAYSAQQTIEKLKAYEEKQKADGGIDEKITGFLERNNYTVDEVFNRLKRMKGEE